MGTKLPIQLYQKINVKSVKIRCAMIYRLLYRIYCSISWGSKLSPIKRLVSKWACPTGAEEHFWHDGCPDCDIG